MSSQIYYLKNKDEIILEFEVVRTKKVDYYTKKLSIDTKITKDNIDIMNIEEFDFIVDACDSLDVKKELLRICKLKNKKLIMSMGTANKLDPTRLKITDLSKTNYDPIAKILRKYVKDNHIKGKIPVVSSDEVPIKLNGKLGSVSFVPSVAGLFITSYIVREVIYEKN